MCLTKAYYMFFETSVYSSPICLPINRQILQPNPTSNRASSSDSGPASTYQTNKEAEFHPSLGVELKANFSARDHQGKAWNNRLLLHTSIIYRIECIVSSF